MVDISADTFAKNCIHIIKQLRKGKEPVLWIRIKDVREKLDVKNIETNLKLIIQQKKHGSEFIEGIKFMYAYECIIIPVTMHCGVSTPKSIDFRSKLGFNQYDITLAKEESVLK